METRIYAQAAQLAASLALGVVLGFVYDLLRLPRRLFPRLGVLVDLGFCFVMAAGLFLLGMAGGGTLRFYMPFAAALGAAGYAAAFGRWLRPLLERMEAFLRKNLGAMKNALKNLYKKLKNIFSRPKKWFRIFENTRNDKVGKNVSKSGARSVRRKGEHDENSKDGHSGKTYYPGGPDLRPFHDG